MTVNANAAVIQQLLNAALPEGVEAYELDQVPATRPEEYVEIALARRFGGERRQCGGIGTTGYRLTVRAISHVTVDNVRSNLEAARSALEFARLVVGNRTSTPLQFETERPAGSDSGWFLGIFHLTYVI